MKKPLVAVVDWKKSPRGDEGCYIEKKTQFEKQKNYYSFNIPVILRGAVRRSRRIHDRAMNPRPPGERGPSWMVGEGLESVFSTSPHPP